LEYIVLGGILTNTGSLEEKKAKDGKCHTRHPSQDYLLSANTENVVDQMESLTVGK